MVTTTQSHKASLPNTLEWQNVDPKTFRNEIVPRDRPAVMRGLIGHWPVVQAGLQSPRALHDYIRARDSGTPTPTFKGSHAIKGNFTYRDDMSGLNFEKSNQPFHATTAAILAHMERPDRPAIYAPAASGPNVLPAFVRDNVLEILDSNVIPRLWIGNEVTAPTHYDMSDGVACVAAGRKRFTLFPPEQLPNLYVGPLELTPGGQPTSLVNVSAPDLERFPHFAEALAMAEVAELGAGDAVFIPNMWWHNVESLEPINLLVNYWWSEGGQGAASPFAALALGLMAIPALPASRREVWRKMFEHYVFQSEGNPVPYLAPEYRGMLGTLNPRLENYMREQVIRSLVKTLPKAAAEQALRRILAQT